MDPQVEILYKELVRLNEVINTYVFSSFSDFQLLGVIGFILTWEPIAKNILNLKKTHQDENKLILIGFLALIFVFFIIATRDLMKQSIVFFYMQEVKHYEASIQDTLKLNNANIFNLSTNWNNWYVETHRYVSYHFRLLMFLFISLFPTIILWNKNKKYSAVYIIFVMFLTSIYIHSALYFS